MRGEKRYRASDGNEFVVVVSKREGRAKEKVPAPEDESKDG